MAFMRFPKQNCVSLQPKITCYMNRIKELLEAKGMSQTELAHRLGKCFNTVNLYAANRVQPPVAVLYRIADILDVDVRELLVPSLRKSN